MNRLSRLLHEIKSWIEGFAKKPSASFILLLLAFIEASLFPIAPDLLLLPLAVMRPKRSMFYAAVCVVGSTCGAILGYYVGYGLFGTVVEKFIDVFGWTAFFQVVLNKYSASAWSALLLAGFTPIPFLVFTVAAGFKQTIDLGTFVLATFIGRSLRFFLVGVLLFMFGPKVKLLLDKYLERTAVAAAVLIAVWLFATKLLLRD